MEGKSNWMLLQPPSDLASNIPSEMLQDYLKKTSLGNIIPELNHVSLNLVCTEKPNLCLAIQ